MGVLAGKVAFRGIPDPYNLIIIVNYLSRLIPLSSNQTQHEMMVSCHEMMISCHEMTILVMAVCTFLRST